MLRVRVRAYEYARVLMCKQSCKRVRFDLI